MKRFPSTPPLFTLYSTFKNNCCRFHYLREESAFLCVRLGFIFKPYQAINKPPSPYHTSLVKV